MTAAPPPRPPVLLALVGLLAVATGAGVAQEEPGHPGGATANQGRDSNATPAIDASQDGVAYPETFVLISPARRATGSGATCWPPRGATSSARGRRS